MEGFNMFKTKRDISYLDIGYNNAQLLTFSESEHSSRNRSVYVPNKERNELHIKTTDIANGVNLEIPFEGVVVGDTLEFSFDYLTNSSDITVNLYLLVNGIPVNDLLVPKRLKLQSTNGRWKSYGGVLPIVGGIANNMEGVVFSLGFKNGVVGEAYFRDIEFTTQTKSSINCFKSKFRLNSKEAFMNEYLKSYYLRPQQLNYNKNQAINLKEGRVGWDNTEAAFKINKLKTSYNSNTIYLPVDYETRVSGKKNQKFIAVDITYKTTDVEGNGCFIGLNHSSNNTVVFNTVLLNSPTYVTQTILLPFSFTYPSGRLYVVAGFKNVNTDGGNLFIKDIQINNSVFTNLAVNNGTDIELNLREDIATGDKSNGSIMGMDGSFIQWKTLAVDMTSSVLTNGKYVKNVSFANAEVFHPQLPYSYTTDLIYKQGMGTHYTLMQGTMNNAGGTIWVISENNTESLEVKVNGFGRWK